MHFYPHTTNYCLYTPVSRTATFLFCIYTQISRTITRTFHPNPPTMFLTCPPSQPIVQDILSIHGIIFPFLCAENEFDLQPPSETSHPNRLILPHQSLDMEISSRGTIRTSSGGFNPHFFARSQRCNRVTPTHGPYFDVRSNIRSMSKWCYSVIFLIPPVERQVMKGRGCWDGFPPRL